MPCLESERGRDGGDDLGYDAVEVAVRRVVVVEVGATYLVDRLQGQHFETLALLKVKEPSSCILRICNLDAVQTASGMFKLRLGHHTLLLCIWFRWESPAGPYPRYG